MDCFKANAFPYFFLVVALLFACLVGVLPKSQMLYLAHLMQFFQSMIPVLAVGALVKYLFNNSK
jgi:hypothetical membrane protein